MGVRPQFDCLYLDMNGIVHNATHANSSAADSMSEDEMFLRIFQYIDKLFKIVQPQKLIYMALDGVAPRAKMNQQRQRRFKSALDAQESREAKIQSGEITADSDEAFDRNCITPGTIFMDKLSAHIQYYIRRKIHEDPQWQRIQVIFSGSDSVGEGEHKIMSYLRAQRMQPDYNPNLRHCIYGLDADLLMLSLLSHEHNTCLLREEVVFGPPKESRSQLVKPGEFQLLHIGLLREYLHLDLQFDAPWYNLDRLIDDIVLICYLVGNDFLPHIPTIRIPLGGLDILFRVYSENIMDIGGYLSCYGSIDIERLITFFKLLAVEEPAILDQLNRQRQKLRELRDDGPPAWLIAQSNSNPEEDPSAQHEKLSKHIDLAATKPLEQVVHRNDLALMSPAAIQQTAGEKASEFLDFFVNTASNSNTTETAPTPSADETQAEAKPVIVDLDSLFADSDEESTPIKVEDESTPTPRVDPTVDAPELLSPSPASDTSDGTPASPGFFFTNELFEDGDDIATDLHSDLTYENYYRIKMPNIENTSEGIQRACVEYIEGIYWVYRYYYQGVPSWRWNYRHLHSPLLADLARVDPKECQFTFDIDYPFTPLQQLMGVLPPQSAGLLPTSLRPLMLNASSAIKDFYPESFEVDMDGKRNDWEGIPLIPFIDENRLVDVMAQIPAEELSVDDRRRNINSSGDMLFEYDKSLKHQPYSLKEGYTTMIALCHPHLVNNDGVTSQQPYSQRLFPDMPSCCVTVKRYIVPEIPSPPGHLFETKGEDDATSLLHDISPALDGKVIEEVYNAAIELDKKYLRGKILSLARYLPIHLPKAVQPLEGFPTLAGLQYTTNLTAARIAVFGRASFRKSMLIQLYRDNHPHVMVNQSKYLDRDGLNTKPHPFPDSLVTEYQQDDINDLIQVAQRFPPSRVVWCDYPYFRPGRVEYITDGFQTAITDGAGKFSIRPSQADEQKFYKKNAPLSFQRYRTMMGVELPKSKVVLMISPIIGMTRSPVGSIIPKFDMELDLSGQRKHLLPLPGPFYAHPFTVYAVPPVHLERRWVSSANIKHIETHAVGDEVVYTGPTHYGCIGVIEEVHAQKHGKFSYSIRLQQAPPCVTSKMNHLASQHRLTYFPSHKLARAFNIQGSTLGRLTGEMFVSASGRDRINIGLSLRFADRGLVVPDYARQVNAWNAEALPHERSLGEQWEYSTYTAVLIDAYKKKFPELFAFMDAHPDVYRFKIKDFCPQGVNLDAYTARLKDFLASLNISSLVAVPNSSRQLPLPAVRKLEEFVYRQYDPQVSAQDKQEVLDITSPITIDLLLTDVHENHFMKHTPEVPYSPTTLFHLCDRVTVIRKDVAPLGLTGTVIGVHSTYLEILLDQTWISAITIRNKCLHNIGIITDMTSVLNLSRPHVTATRYDYQTYNATGALKQDPRYAPPQAIANASQQVHNHSNATKERRQPKGDVVKAKQQPQPAAPKVPTTTAARTAATTAANAAKPAKAAQNNPTVVNNSNAVQHNDDKKRRNRKNKNKEDNNISTDAAQDIPTKPVILTKKDLAQTTTITATTQATPVVAQTVPISPSPVVVKQPTVTQSNSNTTTTSATANQNSRGVTELDNLLDELSL